MSPPRDVFKLTEEMIAALVPESSNRKYADGRGLSLVVYPNGRKFWRMKYRFVGREKSLSFGAWPEVTLEEARYRLDIARRYLRDGIDPSYVKRHMQQTTGSTLFPSMPPPQIFCPTTDD